MIVYIVNIILIEGVRFHQEILQVGSLGERLNSRSLPFFRYFVVPEECERVTPLVFIKYKYYRTAIVTFKLLFIIGEQVN